MIISTMDPVTPIMEGDEEETPEHSVVVVKQLICVNTSYGHPIMAMWNGMEIDQSAVDWWRQ